MQAPTHERCDPERLVELVRSGDPSALEAITRCYGERLLAAGRRHCRTATEAEDAVQDALLVAASDLEAFRGDGSLEGYLTKVVARACRRISRGTKNDPKAHDSEHELASAGAAPDALAEQRELGGALDELLLSLDPEDRAVLLLAEVEGYTGPEIAAKLGLSQGAVRTRLTRLRRRMREGLARFVEPELPPL